MGVVTLPPGATVPTGWAVTYDASMIIDLNADVGESYGAWVMGADADLMP